MVQRNEYQECSDENLLASWQAGDRNAGGILYARYYKSLLAYCFSKGCDKYSAEDILQNTYLKIMDRMYKGNLIINFRAYLFASTRINILAHQMKERSNIDRIKNITERSANSFTTDDIKNFLDKDEYDHIVKVLGAEQQKLFQLYLNSYSRKEIADITNLSENQVRGKLYRVIQKLREIILSRMKYRF